MSTATSPRQKRRAGCPLCGQSTVPEHAPFCSPGCRDRDLINWLSDSYRVPGPPAEENIEDFGAHGLDREQ